LAVMSSSDGMLLLLTAYLYSHHIIYPYLSRHSTHHRTTILHGLNKQHSNSKPSNTSTSPCSTLSPLFFMFLRQVRQPSHSSQPKLRRLRLPPMSSMQNSHQLQHRHRGSMLKELAYLPTLSTLSTTSNSFILEQELMFTKSQSQNLFVALFLIGVAISPFLT